MTYSEFIQNIIDLRGQWGIDNTEYWEGHHIVPKCKGGGGNSRDKHCNVIRLYPEEHFMAHKLLAQENPYDWELVNAFHCISHMNADTNKREISKQEYDDARRMMSECIKNSYPYTIECVETGELFRCPSDVVVKYPHIHKNHLGQCCKGKRITTGGYHWRYFNCDDFVDKKGLQKMSDIGPILCVETGKVYEHACDIYTGHRMYAVINCCRGKACTAFGCHWEFVNVDLKQTPCVDRRTFGRLNWSDESKEHYIKAQKQARSKWTENKKQKEKSRKSIESGSHRWFTDGVKNVFCKPSLVPQGFIPGRVFRQKI